MEFPAIHDDAFGTNELYLHLEDVTVNLPDNVRLEKVLTLMSEQEAVPFREVNFIFCSDEYLLQMNRTHLNHDYFTDVITFPHLESALCGDVFISTDRVAENARKLGVTFDNELVRVMLHGALHLCGYTDTTPQLKKHMRLRENHYLSCWKEVA
jgi:rRNA maturation RNase YbeY